MTNIYFLFTLLSILVKTNSQAPTASTAGSTTILSTPIQTAPTAGSTTTTIIIPPAPTIPSTSTQSPQLCPPTGIHHLPTENCQNFIVCIYGRDHMGNCAEGFLFDPVTSSCLSASVVDCGTRIRP